MKPSVYRYRRFKPITMYYHITRPENVKRIEREGLRADADGNIFAFTDLLVADTIAATQVFAPTYAIFWIRPAGIVGKPYADDVAEFSRPFQCIIRQERIVPWCLRYLGTMTVSTNDSTPWQRMVNAMLERSRA